MTAQISQRAFITAHALARAYGHLWGDPRVAEQCQWHDPVPLDMIHAASAALGQELGIAGPELDGDTNDADFAVVVHHTASRRLWWRVLPNGGVSFSIQRPGGFGGTGISVLAAHVSGLPEGALCGPRTATVKIGQGVQVDGPSEDGPLARHFMALREAIAVLVGDRAAWNAILPLAAEHGCNLFLAPPSDGATATSWRLLDAIEEMIEKGAATDGGKNLHGINLGRVRSVEEAWRLLVAPHWGRR